MVNYMVKRHDRSQGLGCNMNRYQASVGIVWLINYVPDAFFVYAVGKCQQKRGAIINGSGMRQ